MLTRYSTWIASLVVTTIAALMFGCSQQAEKPASSSPGQLDRTILPIQEPKRQTYKELDARKAKAPARFEVKAPRGRPERGRSLDRRHRLWRLQHLWRTDQHAEPGKDRRHRTEIQSLSHDGVVFPDAHGSAHGLQPSQQQRRLDHGNLDGISRQYRRKTSVDNAYGGSSATKWIQHRGFWQVP